MHQCTDIQCFVPDQRERAGRIHGHRGQNRVNVFLKIGIHILRLLLRQLLVLTDNRKANVLQRRNRRAIVRIVLQLH